MLIVGCLSLAPVVHAVVKPKDVVPLNPPAFIFDPPKDVGKTIPFELELDGTKKTIPIVVQNPPSLLEFNSFRRNPVRGSALAYALFDRQRLGDELYVDFVFSDTSSLSADSYPAVLTTAMGTVNPSDPRTARLDGFSVRGVRDVWGESRSSHIQNQDQLLKNIGAKGKLEYLVGTQRANYTTGNSFLVADRVFAPHTNCAKISGDGRKKIVMLRGESWNSSVEEFLWEVSLVREDILSADPFKSKAGELSFFVDLEKHREDASLPGYGMTTRNNCGGSGQFLYIIFIYDPSAPIGKSDRNSGAVIVNIAKTDKVHDDSPTSVGVTALRAITETLTGLKAEEFVLGSLGTVPNAPLSNCTLDVFDDFRDPDTNYMYGAIDQEGCMYDRHSLSRGQYFRSAVQSVLFASPNYRMENPQQDAKRFTVVQCAHLLTALQEKLLTKENIRKNFPACAEQNMNTVKTGIPPRLPAPRITRMSYYHPDCEQVLSWWWEVPSCDKVHAFVVGGTVIIRGSGFSPRGNAVQILMPYTSGIDTSEDFHTLNGDETLKQKMLTAPAGSVLYEVTDIRSSRDGTEISFTIPAGLPFSKGDSSLIYTFRIGALNSNWFILIARVVPPPPRILQISPIPKRGGGYEKTLMQVSFEKVDFPEWLTLLVQDYPKGEKFQMSIPKSQEDGRLGSSKEDISEVKPNTKYVFAITSKTFDQYTFPSNRVVYTTPSALKPVVLRVYPAGPSSIRLEWTDTDADSHKDYEIYSTREDGSEKNPAPTFVHGESEYIVESLTPGQLHCFRVYSLHNLTRRDSFTSPPSNTACAIPTEEEPFDADLASGLSGEALRGGISGDFGLSLDAGTLARIGSLRTPGNVPLRVTGVDFVGEEIGALATDREAPWNVTIDTRRVPNGQRAFYGVIHLSEPWRGSTTIRTRPIIAVINNPLHPSGIVLSGTAPRRGEVLLEWQDNLTNESAFEVQRSKGGTIVTMHSLPGNTSRYTFNNLPPQEKSTFRVRAVFGTKPNHTYSPWSRDVEIETLPKAPPPSLDVSSVDSTTVRVTWDGGTDNAFKNFMLFDGNGQPLLTQKIAEREYRHVVSRAGLYCYAVQGFVNDVNYSDRSDSKCIFARGPLPVPPELLRVEWVDVKKSARITWRKEARAELTEIVPYYSYRSSPAVSGYFSLASRVGISPVVGEWSLPLTRPGTHCFALSGIVSGVETDKGRESCITLAESDLQGGSLRVSSSDADGFMTLSVVTPIEDIDSVHMYAYTPEVANSTRHIGEKRASPWQFIVDSVSLPNGDMSFYAVVRRKNADAPQSLLPAYTTNTITFGIRNPVVTILHGVADKRGQVELRWNDQLHDEKGYSVQKFLGERLLGTDVLPPNTTRTRVSGLQPSQSYRFKVRSFKGDNPSSYIYSPWSDVVEVKTLPKPLAPVVVGGGQGEGRILLRWDDRNGGDDIEYAVFETSTGSAVATNVRVKEYTISGLTRGTYCYTVRAYVNPVNYSDMSKEVCANPTLVEIVPNLRLTAEKESASVGRGLSSEPQKGRWERMKDAVRRLFGRGESNTELSGNTVTENAPVRFFPSGYESPDARMSTYVPPPDTPASTEQPNLPSDVPVQPTKTLCSKWVVDENDPFRLEHQVTYECEAGS